jgi:hypothetical protein
VPVGHVLVCDTRGDVEHDDAALSVDVVSVAEAAKLLLAGCVPDVELDGAEVLLCLSACRGARVAGRGTYGGEAERVHLDAERRNVLLLELSGQMALDKGRLGALLAGTTGKRARQGGMGSSAASASRSAQHDAGGAAHLSSAAIADKHELEGGRAALCGSLSHCGGWFVVVAGWWAQKLQWGVLADAEGRQGGA